MLPSILAIEAFRAYHDIGFFPSILYCTSLYKTSNESLYTLYTGIPDACDTALVHILTISNGFFFDVPFMYFTISVQLLIMFSIHTTSCLLVDE